jgi:hypothetical protein
MEIAGEQAWETHRLAEELFPLPVLGVLFSLRAMHSFGRGGLNSLHPSLCHRAGSHTCPWFIWSDTLLFT